MRPLGFGEISLDGLAEKYRVTKESGISRSGGVNLSSGRLVRMKQKVTTCIVYLCAAISSMCLLKSFPSDYRPSQWALIASASALLMALILVFRWPSIIHWLGLISGLIALYWFHAVEFGYPFPALNTWVVFNLPDATPGSSQEIWIAKLKIAVAITALATTGISATRLLPARWIIRKRPVRDRSRLLSQSAPSRLFSGTSSR